MSRITCLIIFSGSSALSIRSFRLARTRVETLSSNAITTPLKRLLLPSGCVWILASWALRTSRSCDRECRPRSLIRSPLPARAIPPFDGWQTRQLLQCQRRFQVRRQLGSATSYLLLRIISRERTSMLLVLAHDYLPAPAASDLSLLGGSASGFGDLSP